MLGDPRFDSVTAVLTVAAGSAAGTLARWGLDRERAVTVPLGGLGRKEIGQIVAGRGFPPFRPWNFGPLSVDFPAPKFGAHGHIADGGSPETSLKAHNPRSAAYTSGGGSGLTKK
jgi:hypothetical protein